MKFGIKIKNIWHDNQMFKFLISSSNGVSIFVNEVYVDYGKYDQIICDLDRFKSKVYGGIYDINFGCFGSEYASGAFSARLHFHDRGKINVSIHSQSEFRDFGIKNVASESKLYFVTEPSLLDNFIQELKNLKAGQSDQAILEIC